MAAINKISKILLVDDDEINNFYNESLLKDDLRFKGDIHACLHGKDALDYLKNEGSYVENGTKYPKPDLILLDINMPIMNGFEFLDQYKSLPEEFKAKIVIYMLTSSLNAQDKVRASEYPDLTEYIRKPLNAKELEKILEKHYGLK